MMIRIPVFAGLMIALFALFANACKKPTPFGSELLENEYADLEFTDTITVICTLEREDSVLTSDRSASSAYFLCGQVQDPVFGKYSAQIYTLFQAETLNPRFDTSKIVFDSLVLYLNYAAGGVYGDTLQPQNLRVYHLADDLIYDSTYYSTASIPQGQELGRIDNFYPRPSFTDSLFEGVKGPFIKLRLNDDFGKSLMLIDTLTYLSDSAFYRFVNGLKIECSSSSTPGAMLAFDLNDNSLSRMSMYYTVKSDTSQERFDFFFRNTNKFTHFDHDYSGSEAGAKIGQELDERLYIHGMHGVRVKVSFPYLNNFDNIAVNKAQLVLTVADNEPWLKPADQLILTEKEGDSTFVFTTDVLYALGSAGTGSLSAFGGFPEKEVVGGPIFTRYRMTLSDRLQAMVDDDTAPDIKNRTVYLNVYPRTRSAKRTVLFGPKNSSFPAKLELKYTKIK